MTRGESPTRGVLVRSTPVYDRDENIVALRVTRELPDGTRATETEPVERSDAPPETPADRMWRDR